MRWSRMLWVSVCFVLSMTIFAQGVPTIVVETAISATQATLNTDERPISWTFLQLSSADNTALNCPLATTSTPLSTPVTPWRMDLEYANGNIYTVHVATDGSIVQLCDEDFGGAVLPQFTPSPDLVCTLTLIANTPLYQQASTTSANIASLFTGATGEGLLKTSDGNWYQYQTDSDQIGWLPASAVTASAGCDSLGASDIPTDESLATTCFILPAGAFSNVRSGPDTTFAQVDQIFENTTWQVFGRNEGGTWFLINSGWVASSVTTFTGNCSNVPVVTDANGVAPSRPDQLDLMTTYACPANYVGYLAPRITTGDATAKIAEGQIPNTLREAPVANDALAPRLGVIQPNRTLDQVLSGPACSDGYVWWQVEIDGIQGWTVESDVSRNEYYMEPLGDVAIPPTSEPVANQPVQPTSENNGVPAITVNEALLLPALDLVMLSDDSQFLYTVTPDSNTRLSRLELATNASIAYDHNATIEHIGFMPDDAPYLIDANGLMIRLVAETMTLDRTLVQNLTRSDSGYAISIHPDSVLMLNGACAQGTADGCTQGAIDLYNLTNGEPIRRQPAHPDVPVAVDFINNGQAIVSVGDDGAQIWDTVTGQFVNGIANEGVQVLDVSTSATHLTWATCANTDSPCINPTITQYALDDASQTWQVADLMFDPFVAMTASDTRLYIGIETAVYAFDSATGDLVARYVEFRGALRDIFLDADNITLYMSTSETMLTSSELP